MRHVLAAHINVHVRVQLAQCNQQVLGRLGFVQCHDDRHGVACTGGVEYAGLSRVAVIYRVALGTFPDDNVGVKIQRDECLSGLREHLADAVPDTPETRDHNRCFDRVFGTFVCFRFGNPDQAHGQSCEHRGKDHAEQYDQQQLLEQRGWQQFGLMCKREQHEREFAALREYQRHGRADPGAQPEKQCDRQQDDEFRCKQQHHKRQGKQRVIEEKAEVDRHAHGHEKQAEQKAAERVYFREYLVAIKGIRYQQPGNERAHRHRQTRRLGCQRCAQHDQHGRRGEYFGIARECDTVKQRVQKVASHEHDEAENQQ